MRSNLETALSATAMTVPVMLIEDRVLLLIVPEEFSHLHPFVVQRSVVEADGSIELPPEVAALLNPVAEVRRQRGGREL